MNEFAHKPDGSQWRAPSSAEAASDITPEAATEDPFGRLVGQRIGVVRNNTHAFETNWRIDGFEDGPDGRKTVTVTAEQDGEPIWKRVPLDDLIEWNTSKDNEVDDSNRFVPRNEITGIRLQMARDGYSGTETHDAEQAVGNRRLIDKIGDKGPVSREDLTRLEALRSEVARLENELEKLKNGLPRGEEDELDLLRFDMHMTSVEAAQAAGRGEESRAYQSYAGEAYRRMSDAAKSRRDAYRHTAAAIADARRRHAALEDRLSN
jgi:hypothetical protein